jgi:hypothetical protein
VNTKETTWDDPNRPKKKTTKQQSDEIIESIQESEWVEKYDKKKDKTYWKNYSTGETTWKDPHVQLARSSSVGALIRSSSDGVSGDWVEKYDETRKKLYWKNKHTKETTWKDPHECLSPNENINDNGYSGSGDWVEKFDKKKQKTYWKNYSSGETTWRDPTPPTVELEAENLWEEKYSSKKKRTFWKSTSTGETTWHDPTVLTAQEEEEEGEEWIESYDEDEERKYWKNRLSFEVVFVDPNQEIFFEGPGKHSTHTDKRDNADNGGRVAANRKGDNAKVDSTADNDMSTSADSQLLIKYAALEKKYNVLKKSFGELNSELTHVKNLLANSHEITTGSGNSVTKNAAPGGRQSSPDVKTESSSEDRELEEDAPAEVMKRPTSFRLSTKALSSLGSSTKSLLKGDDNDHDEDEEDDVMDDEMMRKRQMAARSTTGSSRRSSSGIQMDYSSRRRASNIEDEDLVSDSSKKPQMSLSVYESGTGVAHNIERLQFRGDSSTTDLSNEVKIAT